MTDAPAPPKLRPTRQRAAVAGILGRTPDFRTAQQLHEALRDEGLSIGLTTVYRTLQAMAEGGQVDVVRSADGESMYRRCMDDAHHHHLVCRRCGRTEEIDGPEVERWAAAQARAHGYSDVTHVIELFGVCNQHQ